MLKIIENTKIWFAASLIVIMIGLGFLAYRGLNFGIDFKGGTQVTIDFSKDFDKEKADEIIKKYAKDAVTNTVDKTQLEIKANDEFNSAKVSEMFEELKKEFSLDDKALASQDQIGAAIGSELTRNAAIALGIAVIGMLLYVAFRFEFHFGVAAILALIHDVLITLSVYTIFNVPVNSPFIAAMLTIIGYSINDTIVIFDRIRENIKKNRRKDLTEIADVSITQTMGRSINTTFTTLVTIVAVYFFVPTVREFAFPLIIGVATGAYSSIFVASPIWVILKKSSKKNKSKKNA